MIKVLTDFFSGNFEELHFLNFLSLSDYENWRAEKLKPTKIVYITAPISNRNFLVWLKFFVILDLYRVVSIYLNLFQRLLWGHEWSDEKNILLKKVFMTQKIIKESFFFNVSSICLHHGLWPLATIFANCTQHFSISIIPCCYLTKMFCLKMFLWHPWLQKAWFFFNTNTICLHNDL